MQYITVSTQIVRPTPDPSQDIRWIPLEETHTVNKQIELNLNLDNWKVIVTHRRAIEHYKFQIASNIPILCVGIKTKLYLESQGYTNISYHKSATEITLEDRYYYLWLRGTNFKVNFAGTRENVVGCKTYSTSSLRNNVNIITNIKPSKLLVYSQEQYELIKESGYVPDKLIIVPSIKIGNDIWPEVITVNPA